MPFSLTRDAPSVDGVALLPRRTILANVGPSGDDLILDAELEAAGWARRVVVACSAARAGYSDRAPEPHIRRPRGPGWLPRAASLEIFRDPGGVAALTLEAPSREWLPLRVPGRRAGWARVSWRGRTGAVVVGWVPRSAIRPIAALPVAYASRTQCPPFLVRSLHEPLPAVPGEPFVGRATIDVGQSVHAEPDGAPWARVARADVFTVMYSAESAWARVIDTPDVYTPGVCDHRLCHAWVPRSAVHALAEREVAR